MKKRLSKSINRLEKEKKISDSNNSESRGLSSYNVKVFRSLVDKYDLSLTINENEKLDGNKQETLSLGAELTLERIKKGEIFKL